ncbi:MAG: response regulator [Microcoleaceae cyanobacterium]
MLNPTEKMTTILLIDDNPTNLEVLYTALNQYGYEIFIEMDGKSGIKQAEETLPDLILLDVMMPGIDGFETCCQLKDNPLTENIPIIFMTALSDTVDKVKGLELGAVDYITKPFQQDEVIARIQVHLKLRQLTLELKQEKLNLEVKVKERTAELQNALEELKDAQQQIVQNEKMSSLGQLVAGIAHEINNPINFIAGNVKYLEVCTQELINITSFCQQKYSNDSDLNEIIENADLDFMIKDLPRLISSMKLGSKRIGEIVAGLRNFSRLDEAAIKPANLHEGLESTLLLLRNRLNATVCRPEIEVVKSYGDLPLVECNAGQMNQVFMNILNNAIDTLDEKSEQGTIDDLTSSHQKSYQIYIKTQMIKLDWIQISIKDNGGGIYEAIQPKIFDPFFTTKPVGKGTGLGLSISYKIITDKHNGQLFCLSEPGKETEFVIEIPVESQSVSFNHTLIKTDPSKMAEVMAQ